MAETKARATAPVETTAAPMVAATQPPIDFDALQHVSSAVLAATGARGGNGSLSINVVFSESNGRRVKLSQALHAGLGSPTQVQVAQFGQQLVIGETLPGAGEDDVFKFSSGKGTTTIYSAGLTAWLVDTFNLDFSGGRVSRSYPATLGSKVVNGSTITFAVVDFAG